MAAGTKINIVATTLANNRTYSWSSIDPEAEQSDIQAVATALITNGSIFQVVPLAVKSIKLVTTTETSVPFPA